jgi:2-dehydropantoate 2-reductase
MHCVVVGAGAVGTLYGGWLLAGGGDVSFLARGTQLAALREKGLILRGGKGDYHQAKIRAADNVADLDQADILLLTVKLYDLDSAAQLARPLLKSGGLVIGLQNGVDAADTLGRHFAPSQIMVGPVYSAARLSEPGIVDYSGQRNSIILGAPDETRHELAETLIGLWRQAGIDATLTDDIKTVLWTKFLVFATNAALTCLTRQPAGVLYHDPDLLDLTRRFIEETASVARSEGVLLPDSAIDDALRLLQGFPPDVVASMRQDLDAGRRLELDGVSGAIRHYGRKNGVPTPYHDTAFACLKPYREGIRQKDAV